MATKQDGTRAGPVDSWCDEEPDGTLRRVHRTSGQRCPLCREALPVLEDQLLFTGWLLHSKVTCEHGCGTRFEIVNSDPLELKLISQGDED